MKNRALLIRYVLGIFLALVLVGTGVGYSMLTGCGGEDCLVLGENCTTQYKKDNYGTTSIYCCNGSCRDSCYSNGKYYCRVCKSY
jgi:hypothetical protein